MEETKITNPRHALHILKKKYPDAPYELSQVGINLETNEIIVFSRCSKNTLENPFCIETFDSEGNHIMHECKQGKS